MSKHLLAFLLTELQDIRVICESCGSAIEIKIDRLDKNPARPMKCSGCDQEFRDTKPGDGKTPDAFDHLAKAIRGLKSLSGVQLEFVVPEKDQASPAKQN